MAKVDIGGVAALGVIGWAIYEFWPLIETEIHKWTGIDLPGGQVFPAGSPRGNPLNPGGGNATNITTIPSGGATVVNTPFPNTTTGTAAPAPANTVVVPSSQVSPSQSQPQQHVEQPHSTTGAAQSQSGVVRTQMIQDVLANSLTAQGIQLNGAAYTLDQWNYLLRAAGATGDAPAIEDLGWGEADRGHVMSFAVYNNLVGPIGPNGFPWWTVQ